MASIRIPLASKKYPGMFALVDECDVDLILQFRWMVQKSNCVDGLFYAITDVTNGPRGQRNKNRQRLQMHRIVLDAPAGMDVDHINHNGLDNRRSNLRIATRSQNQMNRLRSASQTSAYKGVYWHTKDRRWVVVIRAHGGKKYIGSFLVEELAARMYDRAAVLVHGEFACVNFPPDDDRIVELQELDRQLKSTKAPRPDATDGTRC